MLAGVLGLTFAQKPSGVLPAEESRQVTADSLLADLGCSGCHPGVEASSNVTHKAPDLSHAGLRYQEGYLFEYLQHPVTVRRHIGLSRMPDFRFSPKEALALTLFLARQLAVPPGRGTSPPGVSDPPGPTLSPQGLALEGNRILKALECTTCHTLFGEGTPKAVDLSTTGYRLKTPWLKQYLVDPARFDGEDTPMPASFFHSSGGKDEYEGMTPGSAEMLVTVVEYLSSLGRRQGGRLQKAFDEARGTFPHVDHNLGQKIFLSQNCLACHRHPSLHPWRKHTAPDLSGEGNRVSPQWLRTYLKAPRPVRPFGFIPGSGSRMPDFSLTDREVEVMAAYLSTRKDPQPDLSPPLTDRPLYPYERRKARRLIEEKLSCLGCHRLGDRGGRIGPSLSNIPSRLQPQFVYRVISDPQGVIPGTVMPKTVMPEKNLELLTRFLLDETGQESPVNYLSLVDYPLHLPPDAGDGEDIYGLYCASCHGIRGDGKGFNREFLSVAPAVLSDPVLLSQRGDDTLFDGIYSGAAILGKSPLMPPFGQTLDRSEIGWVITHLRDLCNCEGAPWSRENTSNTVSP
ncbi:MAG: c-type cytochrome [Fidelibacterota bacterium]